MCMLPCLYFPIFFCGTWEHTDFFFFLQLPSASDRSIPPKTYYSQLVAAHASHYQVICLTIFICYHRLGFDCENYELQVCFEQNLERNVHN